MFLYREICYVQNYKSFTILSRKFCKAILSSKLLNVDRKEKFSTKINNQTVAKCGKLQVGNNYEDGKLLYVGVNKGSLKRSLAMMYSLGLGMAVSSPYLYTIASKSTFATCFISLVVIIFIINPIGLYQFGKRHVNELYYDSNNEKYTATVLSPVIFKDRRIKFTSKDCKMPLKPTAFTSFFARNHPMFINSDVMNYQDYMEILKDTTKEYDYENPSRHEDYNAVIQKALYSKKLKDKQ